MFVRMSFSDGQKVSNDTLQQLEEFLSDKIKHDKLVKEVNSDNESLTEFYSWKHTLNALDLEKEGNTKVLVKEVDKVQLSSSKEYLTSLETFVTKFPNIKLTVRGVPGGSSDVNILSGAIQQMQTVEAKLENALKAFDKSIEFNQKCDVHVSNLGLLHINQLGYATDKCTEELQNILDDGWRLIACCVQPDQRRPDYILGRYNPDESDNVKCIQF